jgi:hypothetical protein
MRRDSASKTYHSTPRNAVPLAFFQCVHSMTASGESWLTTIRSTVHWEPRVATQCCHPRAMVSAVRQGMPSRPGGK